ncbi:hypothetical protein [uncultured Zoogloea sp.]|uniref:hypothetical protein n=1 Tax=uncultured Zoogloea sp. TaxID=160237 RepID=UPI002617F4EC|nr:hypothetical protein [uncultured Zoogloea sp.]
MGIESYGRTVSGRLQGPFPWVRLLTPEIVTATPPTVSGTKAPGQTVTAVSGTYTPAGWQTVSWVWTLKDLAGAVYTTGSGANFTIPAGAPDSILTLTQPIVFGGRTHSATSIGYSVTAATAAPIFAGLPVVTGGTTPGSILTATPASASGTPAPTVTGQWYHNGSAIAGLTGVNYTASTAGTYTYRNFAANGVSPNATSGFSNSIVVAEALSSPPALNFVGTGTGEARSYAQTNWDANNVNGQGNASYWGSPLACCAYASFAGNTATDAYTIAGIKGGRDAYGGPALRGGYSAQHDTGYLWAVVWAKLTPRVWAEFDSSWRASLDRFMRWALVAAVGTAREADSAFKGDMLGNTTNASTRGGNPNISSAPSANIAACMAYIGVSTAAAYLQSVVVATEEVAMRSSPWTNIAKSFSLPRVSNAPTHAQIQAACRRGTRFGVPLTDQLGMWEAEVIHAFSKTVSEGYGNGAGIPSSLYAAYPSGSWATGRGRVVPANLAAIRANPEFIAIKGLAGAVREMDSTDAGGIRMSASYSEWTHRMMCFYTLGVLTSGTVDRKSARALALRTRIKAGCTHMRLIGQYGWLSVAHIVQGGLPASPEASGQWQAGGDTGGWDTASRSTQFGLKFQHDLGLVIEGVYDMI